MKTYYFAVTETLNRIVKIQANNPDEALERVHTAYKNEEIILDYNDFNDYEIVDETRETLKAYEGIEMPEFQEIK